MPEPPAEIAHRCADDIAAVLQDWKDSWAGRDDHGAFLMHHKKISHVCLPSVFQHMQAGVAWVPL